MIVKEIEIKENKIEEIHYLDKEKFSLKEINKLKRKRKAYNEYVMGRHYHQQRKYSKAIISYKKSFKMGNCGLKCIAAIGLSLIESAKNRSV